MGLLWPLQSPGLAASKGLQREKTQNSAVDWRAFHASPIIGVDEVGRGCLAGPVVAGAVLLRSSRRRRYYDSKAVSEIRREKLSAEIQRLHLWSIGFASVAEIDRLNIYHASLLAMRRAVEGLGLIGGHLLIDGKAKLPEMTGFTQTTLVDGDSLAEPISAASIVAKVARDTYMKQLAESFPEYGFDIHKGYATIHHRDMLAAMGPCEHHRRSFFGVLESEIVEDEQVTSL